MAQEYNFEDENLSTDKEFNEQERTCPNLAATPKRGPHSSLTSNEDQNNSYLSSHTKRSSLGRRRQICCLLGVALLANVIETGSAFQTSFASKHHSRQRKTTTTLLAKTATPTPKRTPKKQSIQPVQPLKSTSKEKRLSVERAWEQARVLARFENENEAELESISATPYLDLFTGAGMATTVKKVPKVKKNHSRPKGRPASVPGAMSRTTLLNLNEIEARAFQASNENAARLSKTVTAEQTIDIPAPPKKRGRGRPRKNKTDDTSVDEITSIAATSAMNGQDLNPGIALGADGNPQEDTDLQTKQRKSRVQKARKMKEFEKEGETTGMMPFGKKGRNGEMEPPNLQRYYRTQLLTQVEEYTIGMKIQFLMKCEQVHEGLFLKWGRAPTIAEWANACGFTDEDPIRNPRYQEKELEMQIRPVKSEAWDEDTDPNMFVGNGLANDSGPGRGRGRAKKTPPLFLKDYYDDSDTKFTEKPKKKSEQTPINRGTPQDFVELMLTGKEAKQKMVQCNMRLVVSISMRYKHVGVNIADLVQEGSIGLTRAAEKFDPKKGFKFSTYASWWIQQAVFRSIAYHSRTIRLPVHVHNLLNRMRRVRAELKRLYGRQPTNEELAAELDLSVEKLVKMLRLTRKAISLDMAKYQNNPKDIGQESDTSLGDTIDAADVMKDENSPQQTVDRTLFRDDLKEMLKILGEDERSVICARYGINDGLTRTVTTVASQLGQTKSWVRSQECRALRKLRRPWYERRLWEHQNSLRA